MDWDLAWTILLCTTGMALTALAVDYLRQRETEDVIETAIEIKNIAKRAIDREERIRRLAHRMIDDINMMNPDLGFLYEQELDNIHEPIEKTTGSDTLQTGVFNHPGQQQYELRAEDEYRRWPEKEPTAGGVPDSSPKKEEQVRGE